MQSMGSQRVRHDWATKHNAANAEDVREAGWIPESGRSPGGGNGNLLQYSCLWNPMDRRACKLQSMGLQKVVGDWVTEYTPFQIY